MADVTVTDDRPEPIDPATDDPATETVAPEPAADPEPPPELVDPATVRDALDSLGGVLHMWRGHPEVPDHWAFTDGELDALAPPLASIINRHAATRRLAQHSPEAAVALTMLNYTRRNVRLSRQIQEWLASQTDDDDGPTIDVEVAPVDPDQ